MTIAQTLHRQFGRPTGFLGRIAGTIMARRPSNRERNAWVVSLLDIQPSDRVLEIGFGPGLAIEQIAKKLTTGHITGIDHSKVMLEVATRRNASAIASSRAQLQLGNAEELPQFDRRFDKVLAVNSFQFWRAPIEVLQSVKRLMRDGGTLALAYQPRMNGATDAIARESGSQIVRQLDRAGFHDSRLEIREMKPVAVVCAIGFA